MNRLPVAIMLSFFAAEASARGGSCSSGSCSATAAVVLVLCLLAFVASLYDSIRERGLIKGLVTNRAAQWVFGYLAILAVSVGGSFAAAELWGERAALWYLGILCAAAIVAIRLFRGPPAAPTAPKPPGK
jgi:hypothetical protein